MTTFKQFDPAPDDLRKMNDDLANAVADLRKLLASHDKHMSGLQCLVIALELLAKELERLVMATEPVRDKLSFEIVGF